MEIQYQCFYQIGSYSGSLFIWADENAEYETLISTAKRQLSRNAPLPIGYESFKFHRA
jgi:hypothetical protein